MKSNFLAVFLGVCLCVTLTNAIFWGYEEDENESSNYKMADHDSEEEEIIVADDLDDLTRQNRQFKTSVRWGGDLEREKRRSRYRDERRSRYKRENVDLDRVERQMKPNRNGIRVDRQLKPNINGIRVDRQLKPNINGIRVDRQLKPNPTGLRVERRAKARPDRNGMDVEEVQQ